LNVLNPTETGTEFATCVREACGHDLRAERRIGTVQVNIGLKCNLICRHCHVNSSPRRTETMTWETMESVLRLAEQLGAHTVDVTGGAPEMHPDCKRFVQAAREKGLSVIVRTNLTILLEPGYEDFIDFFREQQVELVASLPCYLEENVDAQRGEGVYHESIEAIRRLNAAGYGIDPELPLNLVYNPGGPSLPPNQAALEADYHRELGERFAIRFTHLHTITNVPIGRFRGDLRKGDRLKGYLQLLRDAFNPVTIKPLMCRHQISVGWDGTLYDCDFNLALRWAADVDQPNVHDVDPASVVGRAIVTGDHCFACTAGSGSSCGGALVGE
jgi:radical SAM/Cys-rich protein